MKTFFKQLKLAFSHALAMPERFIATCDTLAEAVNKNTETIEALGSDVLKALGTMSGDSSVQHQELLNPIKYLAASERYSNTRSGHKVQG